MTHRVEWRTTGKNVMGSSVMWMSVLGGGLCCAGLATLLWQWWAAHGFSPECGSPCPSPMPGVTVIKPLCGADPATHHALATWFDLDYPGPVEIVAAAESEDTAALDMARGLIADAADVDAKDRGPSAEGGRPAGGAWPRYFRVVCCEELTGTNGKVAKVIQAAGQARYPLLVVSDADVAAPRGLLQAVVDPLGRSGVGLSCCLYRLVEARTRAMQWEAAAVNIDFWSQVLQARTLGAMDFGLGAVMGISRCWLERIGGLGVVADYLADDYQLGRRVHQAGGRVVLCPVVVDCHEPERGWTEVWRHQLRWARTIRVSRPFAYFASIVGNVFVGPGIWLLAAGAAWWVGVPEAPGLCRFGLLAGMALVSVRLVMAWDLQRRFLAGRKGVPWWMPLVKDLLALSLWVAAFAGNRIEWRGRHYRVRKDGRLEPASAAH